MKTISLELRRKLVNAYLEGLTDTYEETAAMFGVARATVSRLLRRQREEGDVAPKRRGGDLRSSVDRAWLLEHAGAHPDARLVDRIDAWFQKSGRRVSVGAMWNALATIGWTHKKRLPSPANGTGQRSRRSVGASSRRKRNSTRRD